MFGYHILENAPSDVTAYAYLSRIHILLQQSQASNHETEAFQNVVENCSLAQRSHSCSEAYAVLKSAMVILLDEPHAKMNNLKTRLGFTKVALSSLIACQKAGKNLGTEKDSTVLLSSIPADRLIDHPGICEDGLKEECFRIEAELSNMSQNMVSRRVREC